MFLMVLLFNVFLFMMCMGMVNLLKLSLVFASVSKIFKSFSYVYVDVLMVFKDKFCCEFGEGSLCCEFFVDVVLCFCFCIRSGFFWEIWSIRILLVRKIVVSRCFRRMLFFVFDFLFIFCIVIMDVLNLCLNLYFDGVVLMSGEFLSMRARMILIDWVK